MNDYIDLYLRPLDSKDEPRYLSSVISTNSDSIIVILGAPGSGKSSILKKFHLEKPDTSELLKVKKFVRQNPKIKESVNILLLDGLDEYRSIENDKTYIIDELGEKIHNLRSGIQVVVSCREMDWFGERDESALKDYVSPKNPSVWKVLPLDYTKKVELARLLGKDDAEGFVDKYERLGFLENPQSFRMFAKTIDLDNNIGSKKDLYLSFIKNTREQNPEYKLNRVNRVTPDEMLKYSGYLAFYYLFSDADFANENFIDEICSSEFKSETLQVVLNSPLFDNREFAHRTIAEFALANYLYKFKLDTSQPITINKIINLFSKKQKIPTEIRGCYAWLCSLSGVYDLFQIDPYYQAVHGDNSSFSLESKKSLVLAISRYSKQNPYFYQYTGESPLEGFYDPSLDSFIVSEIFKALRQSNHYIFFLTDILASAKNLSNYIIKFVKRIILCKTIPSGRKTELIKCINSDKEFQFAIIERINAGTLEDDDDTLKEYLLSNLYLDQISPSEISKYIIRYRKDVIGCCRYLNNTRFEDMFIVVDDIHKFSYNHERCPKLILPKNVDTFISEYFINLCLKYNNGMSSKNIYDILKHFRKYYESFTGIDFISYNEDINNKLKNKDKDMEKLAGEFFSFYIDDQIASGIQRNCIYHFQHFFSLKSPPNTGALLLSKIIAENSHEINLELFGAAWSNKANPADLEKVASEFGFQEYLAKWRNPVKSEWIIEQEEWMKKAEEDRIQLISKNDNYFSNKTDDQILKNFNDLKFIYKIQYSKHHEENSYVSPNTFERLKNLLKKVVISADLIDPHILNLDSIVKSAPTVNRDIDRLYYTSAILNPEGLLRLDLDCSFFKYLYINLILNENIANIICSSELVNQIETKYPDICINILREYLSKAFSEYLADDSNGFTSLLATCHDVDCIKKIVPRNIHTGFDISDELLNRFIRTFNFEIPKYLLDKILYIAKHEDNRNLILAILNVLYDNKNNFTRDQAISLHRVFEHKNEIFSGWKSSIKVKVINMMMDQFESEESIKYRNGFQSHQDTCARFLARDSFSLLTLEELYELDKVRRVNQDIWTLRIIHAINDKQQAEADQIFSKIPVNKLKEYILSNAILSVEDFFEDVVFKINRIKNDIEDNEDNDKEPFYNSNKLSKDEPACRDEIHRRLKDLYTDIHLTREKYEANNRADINIKYAHERNFEVQVECKKDSNSGLSSGIKEQLIDKYFRSGVRYGIYLVFFFGNCGKEPSILKDDIEFIIPYEHKGKIRVIIIDLRLR